MERVLGAYGVTLEPPYLGKPYPSIFMHNHFQLEKRLGKPIDRRSVLMIGDHSGSGYSRGQRFWLPFCAIAFRITNTGHVEKSRVKPELLFRTL